MAMNYLGKMFKNLFDTFVELINEYKELLEGCKRLSACNL